MRTLLVGTQLRIERLAAHIQSNEKYDQSFAVFSEFADSLRGDGHEFLDPKLYEPFDAYDRLPKAVTGPDEEDMLPYGWVDAIPWEL